MQVNIGEKIKELRKKDGRKQEDLAKALGVTAQAVSRWESNGCYPDMSMIPAIANFFHITIDELFGYNNDREQKSREYQETAQAMMLNGTDTAECIAYLKKALEEFPTATVLKFQLAAALNKEGWNHKGEEQNRFWEEAVSLFEELLPEEQSCIIPLLSTYGELGEYEKAEKKAFEQASLDMSREVLLGRFIRTEKGEQYRGEAVIALLHELRLAIDDSIGYSDQLRDSKEAVDILLALRSLYEKIFGEKRYGYHSDFCFVDSALVKAYQRLKDYESALGYFDSAFEQFINFKAWWEPRLKHTVEQAGKTQKETFQEEGKFETLILNGANPNGGKIYLFETDFLADMITDFPEEIREQLRSNPKYSSIFHS